MMGMGPSEVVVMHRLSVTSSDESQVMMGGVYKVVSLTVISYSMKENEALGASPLPAPDSESEQTMADQYQTSSLSQPLTMLTKQSLLNKTMADQSH